MSWLELIVVIMIILMILRLAMIVFIDSFLLLILLIMIVTTVVSFLKGVWPLGLCSGDGRLRMVNASSHMWSSAPHRQVPFLEPQAAASCKWFRGALVHGARQGMSFLSFLAGRHMCTLDTARLAESLQKFAALRSGLAAPQKLSQKGFAALFASCIPAASQPRRGDA